MADTQINTNQINMGDITGAYFEMTKDMSSGKKTIAEALTEKGTPSTEQETLSQLANKVDALVTDSQVVYNLHSEYDSTGYTGVGPMGFVNFPGGVVFLYQDQLFLFEHYCEFTNKADLFNAAKFSLNVSSYVSTSNKWLLGVSNDGKYVNIIVDSNCSVFRVDANAFTYINTYTLPEAANMSRTTTISNSGEVVLYSDTSSYIRLHVLGANTSYKITDSTVTNSNPIFPIIIENGTNYTAIYSPAETNNRSRKVVLGTFTRSGDVLTRTSTNNSNVVDAILSYPWFPICVSNTLNCLAVWYGDSLYLCKDLDNHAKLISLSGWTKVKIAATQIPVYPSLFSSCYKLISSLFIVKSFDTVAGTAVLDSMQYPHEITVNVNDLTISGVNGQEAAGVNYDESQAAGDYVSSPGHTTANGRAWKLILIGKDKNNMLFLDLGVTSAQPWMWNCAVKSSTSDAAKFDIRFATYHNKPVKLGYKNGNNFFMLPLAIYSTIQSGELDYEVE